MLLEAIISPRCCVILPGAINTVNLGKICVCVCVYVCVSGVNRLPLSLLFSHYPLILPYLSLYPSFLLFHTLPPYMPGPLLGFFFLRE